MADDEILATAHFHMQQVDGKVFRSSEYDESFS